jgi:two-component system, OmpR family, sensor histidine kinase CpxA
MRSLFLKIFLWFWATAILTGIALVLSFVLQHSSVPQRWHAMLEDTARYSGTSAVDRFERDGTASAATYLAQLENNSHVRTCLFDHTARSITGGGCGIFEDTAARVATSRKSDFSFKYGIARVGTILNGRSGRQYIFVTDLPAGPRAAAGISRFGFVLQWGTAFLVSGCICYLLARYITAPVLRLREASQQLATGELSTRAAAGMERRRDELGDLVRDFNSMADRIEQLIATQRQLIYDVSHEVRSPLARLNVALDLARGRKGEDPAFEHMQQDLERLDQTMERMLTIARLDTSASPASMSPLNLTELVSEIVADAQFELQRQDRSVEFGANANCTVRGNSQLLHSAIENVVRNAIRYTSSGSPVQIEVRQTLDAGAARALLTVRDRGPGVPESELTNIFRPFYRIAGARDRDSGGVGLGLAIVERVIRLHGGRVWAENADDRGLRVNIMLPLASDLGSTSYPSG